MFLATSIRKTLIHDFNCGYKLTRQRPGHRRRLGSLITKYKYIWNFGKERLRLVLYNAISSWGCYKKKYIFFCHHNFLIKIINWIMEISMIDQKPVPSHHILLLNVTLSKILVNRKDFNFNLNLLTTVLCVVSIYHALIKMFSKVFYAYMPASFLFNHF